jgi:pimeloyl-ACP methyl ester carboxylesterase
MKAEVSTVELATGLTLSYASIGEPSSPAVLFLPGPVDSWRSYEPVLDLVPSSIRAIAVSQRGHGDSDKPPGGYRVEDFAADVPPLLDALGIDRAVLAGHSGSCMVVRRVAIDEPERVAGVVLESSPTTLRGHAGFAEFFGSVVSVLQEPIEPAFARSFEADTSSEEIPADLLEVLASEAMKVPVSVWKATFAGIGAYDDLVQLERIAAPTLLVWGDADAIVDGDMQTELVNRIPVAELLVYHGAGHTPRWEDPARFARDVAAFVERSVQRDR